MASLSRPVGYECEFVDQVLEDYFCKQCKHVAREPNITSCCTEVLCKACFDVIIEDKQPCPSCESTDISSLGPHKKYQPKILALKVYCSLKDRGCEWIGQLQHLDAHLDLTTGDCVYVDVDCPSKCNQKVQKRNVDTHLANHCRNRDYICPHCSFKATFREVSEHFEVCRYYPLVCPNRCGASFERDDLEYHLSICGSQKIQCEYSYAGCEAEFPRDQEKEHMEQNVQAHLALVAAASLKITQEKEQEFEQKLQKQQQILLEQHQKSLEDSHGVLVKQLSEQKEDFHKRQAILEEKLEEKDKLIKSIPYHITILSFHENKVKNARIDGPRMYTHPKGYRYQITIRPNGSRNTSGFGTHVSVKVIPVAGEYDNTLIFPARFTITLELLNQLRDQDHCTKDIHCEVEDMGGLARKVHADHTGIGCDREFISHYDLGLAADKQTLFIKNNCIKFRVTKLVLH